MIGVVGGETDDGVGADDAAGVGGKKIFLAEVKAGVEKAGIIGAVVDDEERAGAAAEHGDFVGLGENFAAPEGFVAELEDAGIAFEERGGGVDGVEMQAIQRGGVEDGINAGEIQRMIVPRGKCV